MTRKNPAMVTWDVIVASCFNTTCQTRKHLKQARQTVFVLIQIPSKTTHKDTGTQVNNNIFIK